MIKILFISLFFSSLLLCDYIKWQNSYEETLLRAKAQNKDILLLILKDNSENSKKILVDIFAKEEIIKVVNEKYIPVAVFFENKNSYPIELFYTQTFPALFFISSKDELYLNEPIFDNFSWSQYKE